MVVKRFKFYDLHLRKNLFMCTLVKKKHSWIEFYWPPLKKQGCYCFFYLLLHCNWVVLNLPNVCLGILSHFCLDLKFYVLQSPEYVSRSLGVRVKRENRTIKIVESVYRDWNKFWLNCRVFLYFDYISPAMQYSVYNFRQKLSFYQKIVKSFIRSAEVDFFFFWHFARFFPY